MTTDLSEIDLKKLSEVYDRQNRDTYVTLYLDPRTIDTKFIERRVNTCKSILKGNKTLLGNFNKSMQQIKSFLDKGGKFKGVKGIAVFSSNINNFFEAYKLSLPLENMLIADSSPYIRPLARLKDDYETFGLALLDSHRAKLFVVSSGKIKEKKQKAKDIMNKHKKGGWSQARFARLREGAIDRFMKEVAKDVEKLFSRDHVAKIVIAGPGSTKIQFTEYLSHHVKNKIVDVIEIDFDEAEGHLVQRAKELVLQDEKDKDDEQVALWREEILKNGLAVFGLQETKIAVQNGQVDVLLVSKGFKKIGWICEHCQFVDVGKRKKCKYCGAPANEVDVVEEIVEFAIRNDTQIDFVDSNPTLDELGGVGALLRFK
jgi:peptide chain release factor subunit 1